MTSIHIFLRIFTYFQVFSHRSTSRPTVRRSQMSGERARGVRYSTAGCCSSKPPPQPTRWQSPPSCVGMRSRPATPNTSQLQAARRRPICICKCTNAQAQHAPEPPQASPKIGHRTAYAHRHPSTVTTAAPAPSSAPALRPAAHECTPNTGTLNSG